MDDNANDLLVSSLVRSRSKFLELEPGSPTVSVDAWTPHFSHQWCGLVMRQGDSDDSMLMASISEVNIDGQFLPTIQFRFAPTVVIAIPPLSLVHLSLLTPTPQIPVATVLAGIPILLGADDGVLSVEVEQELLAGPDELRHTEHDIDRTDIPQPGKVPVVELLREDTKWVHRELSGSQATTFDSAIHETLSVMRQSLWMDYSTTMLPLDLFEHLEISSVKVIVASAAGRQIVTAELEVIDDGAIVQTEFASGSDLESMYGYISLLEDRLQKKVKVEEIML